MTASKRSISQAQSYEAMGAFWDNHDTTDFWDKTEPIESKVNLYRNLLNPNLIILYQRPERCPRCDSPLVEQTSQYVVWHEEQLLIIRDVPIVRCSANGHEYITEDTFEQVKRLLEDETELPPPEFVQTPVYHLVVT